MFSCNAKRLVFLDHHGCILTRMGSFSDVVWVVSSVTKTIRVFLIQRKLHTSVCVCVCFESVGHLSSVAMDV